MVENPWEAFGTGSQPEVDCGTTGSLAEVVCKTFGIICANVVGGSLPNVDIKHMNAMTVIKLSLLEEAAKSGKLYEPIITADGQIEFKEVGVGGTITDVYYTIQTYDYKEDCAGVMVTGGKPLPKRHVPKWSSILDSAQIFHTHAMASNCLKPHFDQYATIVYNDPHLDSAYEDGIKNLYEINKDNPYDKIIGYAWKLLPPEEATVDTSISLANSTEIPLCVAKGEYPDIGELVRLPTTGEDLNCWVGLGEEAPAGGGIAIDVPPKLRYDTTRGVINDKLLGVTQVYVIGYELNRCVGVPISDAEAVNDPTEENTVLHVSCDNFTPTVYKLNEGVNYVVSYDGEGAEKIPRITFANNSRIYDMAKFGTGVPYKVQPYCAMYDNRDSGIDTILPTGGIAGVLVEEVWVVLSLDTPSINIVDPSGKAVTIAEGLKVECCPLVVTEEPAPVAKDGGLIDLSEGILDHDPTTTQDLTDTALEKAISEMSEGPGLSLSLSFLEKESVAKLSGVLYSYMNNGNGLGTTYICGPDCDSKVGGNGLSGGIINNITYSYTDGGSYTISVTEGPKVLGGFEGISGDVYMKQTEEHSAQGTIIQDAGNHVDYKVRIDGFGDRYAINCCPHVLRVGDRVQVSVHNNPVED